jgi:formyl-CoA transferase
VAPSNTYRCADGAYVVVSGNGDAIFGRLMRLVGRCDLAEDPALRDNAGRVARAGELDEAISAWTGARPHEDALARLEAAGVPGGPILTPADILKDPHYEARGMHVVASVPVGAGEPARVTFPGVVPRLEQAGGQVRWMGPELGADTDDVLAEAGLDPAEVAELRVAGAI